MRVGMASSGDRDGAFRVHDGLPRVIGNESTTRLARPIVRSADGLEDQSLAGDEVCRSAHGLGHDDRYGELASSRE